MSETLTTASHWGPATVRTENGKIVAVDGHPLDPAPSPINRNIGSSLNGSARVLYPSVRKSWLDRGPEAKAGERGRDPFVRVGWAQALDLIAGELTRVRDRHGNGSIFAGSYGWASAGRFHHAQSQLKRFLNTLGGFVRSDGNYSYNAALVLMPHIVANYRWMIAQMTRWTVIAEHSDLVVMFGGMPLRNTQVSDGGVGAHRLPDRLKACAEAGVRFVNVSPLRSDTPEVLNAEWMAPRPGTDTALMMGLAHTLLTEGLHDRAFLDRYTVGFDRVAAYLTGRSDGVPKNADWAERQCGVPAGRIRALAREMAASRTMITTAAGLQRADYGEQPLWMTVTLAAMLGQIGLPGGGFGIGYGVNANVGVMERPYRWATIPQGRNPVETVIPVAMTADMLLNPGAAYDYNGQRFTFPDIRMVWWAGGNPFHHGQDLNKLRRAFQRPETIVVNEINWTATARHADIVLPVAAPQEREDFCAGKSDNMLLPMHKLVEPPGEAMVEFDIYAALERRLLNSQAFTEGRTKEEWVRRLWSETQDVAQAHGDSLPDWEAFFQGKGIRLTDPAPDRVLLADFRADPEAAPLPTPSGKIELFSETVAGFGYDDCPGHATWFPPRGVTDGSSKRYPLSLLSGQPGTRLHSQLDNGDYSKSRKIKEREPVKINTADAAARGIADGDAVEIFNGRGRCLAGAVVTDEIAPGVVFLWTGAWYDPDFNAPDHRDRHGNPNVLTHDGHTSRLSQGTAAHSAFVEIRKFDGPLPGIYAHRQPEYVTARNE